MTRSGLLAFGVIAALWNAGPGFAADKLVLGLDAALQRAEQQIARRDFRGALETLAPFKEVRGASPTLAYNFGSAWLGVERPVIARREYTLALIGNPEDAYAYLGRALAESRWGDSVRAERDYARALSLNARSRELRSDLDEHLAQTKVSAPAERLLADLEKAAVQNAPAADLLDRALRVQRAMATQRKRYDEWYQWYLADLQEAIRHHPEAAAPLVALARFLAQEARMNWRGESVEPRRPLVTYRPFANDYEELHRALRLTEQALALEPRHLPALVTQAEIYRRLGDQGRALAMAGQILALAPKDPTAIKLRAEFQIRHAADYSIGADNLRQSHMESAQHTEYGSEGTREVTVTTITPASESARRRADASDAQADALYAQGNQGIAAALKVLRGTVEGSLLEADDALDRSEPKAALAALQAALKLDPAAVKVHEALAEYYRRTRAPEQSDFERSVAANLLETTAGWRLKGVWNSLAARKFEIAEHLLAEARALDPADARTPAYLAGVREAQGRLPEARSLYRLALALEEARLRLDDLPNRKKAPPPRPPLDFGLSFAIREKLAGLCERENDQVHALEYYRANLAWAEQMSESDRREAMFTAMLPGQIDDRYAVPMPPRGGELLAKAHQHLGKIAQGSGRTEEARAHFQSANRLNDRAKQAENEDLAREMSGGTRR